MWSGSRRCCEAQYHSTPVTLPRCTASSSAPQASTASARRPVSHVPQPPLVLTPCHHRSRLCTPAERDAVAARESPPVLRCGCSARRAAAASVSHDSHHIRVCVWALCVLAAVGGIDSMVVDSDWKPCVHTRRVTWCVVAAGATVCELCGALLRCAQVLECERVDCTGGCETGAISGREPHAAMLHGQRHQLCLVDQRTSVP